MNHQEALIYLENRYVNITNGIFTISGFLFKTEDNNPFYYIDFFSKKGALFPNHASVNFIVDQVESIDVNEEAFLPNVPEDKRYTIVLKG